MKFSIYYDGNETEIDLPRGMNIESIQPRSLELNKTEDEIISDALNQPINAPTLTNFLQDFESILLIVNDHARATPTPKILKHLLPLLESKHLGIIIASGTHNLPSEDDIKNLILGENYSQLRKLTVFHNSKNPESFEFLGKTTRGTEVRVNRIIEEYDAIITINSIEPHYFAGFTGGRKSFLPGIAAYQSIESNHSMALLKESRMLVLKGNPLHEDLEEAAHFITKNHPVFGINVVLDGSGKIVGAFSGNIFDQLYKGAELAKTIYAPELNEPVDILVSIVHSPLDQNLYQAQKGFENCLFALNPGGIMILVASCYDGIGPADYANMLQSAETPKELGNLFEEIKENYRLGWHKVGSIPTFLQDKELWMVTKIPDEQLSRMFIKGFDTIQKAIDEALKIKGQSSRILLVHDSANVCPVLKS
jgi:nickel-dependent lactate racemase